MRNINIATAYDPGLIPSDSGLPPGLVDWLRELGSGVMGAVFVVLGIALVVGVAMWAVGKWGSGGARMQTVGGVGVIVVLVAAFLVGSASALVKWAGETGGETIGQAIDLLPEIGETVASVLPAIIA